MPSMIICRIDLMRNVKLFDEKRVNVDDCKDFPKKIDERFLRQHYNMSYDNPIDFTLKINSKWLTFLHDAFGKIAIVSKINSKENECEVKVKCSLFGMINFAMQYSDKVEIISPEEYRNAMKQRLEKLLKKFNK